MSEIAVSAVRDQNHFGLLVDTGNRSADNSVEGNVLTNITMIAPLDEATYGPVDPAPVIRTSHQQKVVDKEFEVRTLKLLSLLELKTESTRKNLLTFFCVYCSLVQLAYAFRQSHLPLKLSVKKELCFEKRFSVVFPCLLCVIKLDMAAIREKLNLTFCETTNCIHHLKDDKGDGALIFRFHAEPVSHNPPFNILYFECPLKINDKFMGIYASATLIGEVTLEVTFNSAEPSEMYKMSYSINQGTAETRSSSRNLFGHTSGYWINDALELALNCCQSDALPGIPSDLEQRIRPNATLGL